MEQSPLEIRSQRQRLGRERQAEKNGVLPLFFSVNNGTYVSACGFNINLLHEHKKSPTG